MPLYECFECGSVDNTALTNFWDAHMNNKPILCSACDPDIGKWHDKFARETVSQHMKNYPGSQIHYLQAPRRGERG